MRNILFQTKALEQYQSWKSENNQKVISKIKELIKDIQNRPFKGIGKPEPLIGSLQGYWSRRISKEHRLVYKVIEDAIIIARCRFHYEQ